MHTIDFNKIFNEYRADPYGYVDVFTLYTGLLRIKVGQGDIVDGPGGEWHHIQGTVLYELTRERNLIPFHSPAAGVISFIKADLDGHFAEADEKILTIKHPLSKKEIIERILRQILLPFNAPENAKYYFTPEIQRKIDKAGQRSVSLKPGDEILTMSLMKRDTPVFYSGGPGVIHSVYFKAGTSANQGQPLFGVCAPDKLPLIEKIITRVKAEWQENHD